MKPALLVLGATGTVGQGVVAAAVASGRPVIAVARETRDLQALRDRFADADLAIVRGSVADDARSVRLVRSLRRLQRPVDALIASICGDCERGRVLDHPADSLRRMLDQNLVAHSNAARHLLPLLAEGEHGGSYVLIGGPGGEQPWSGYGHRSIIAASLRMLARVLHEEARALSVRVQLLAVDSPLCTDANRAHACPQWPTAEVVGRRALELVDSRGPQPARAIVRYTAPAEPTASTPCATRAPSPGDVRSLIDTLVSSSRLKESSP